MNSWILRKSSPICANCRLGSQSWGKAFIKQIGVSSLNALEFHTNKKIE